MKAFRTAKGIAFPAVNARIRITGSNLKKSVAPGVDFVRFTTKLDAGIAELVAKFTDAQGNEVGAYYVNVNRIDDDRGSIQ